MAITGRRYLKDAVVVVAHQSAFGTPAPTSPVLRLRALRSAVDPQHQYIDLKGTAGAYHPKDTHWKTAEKPVASLTVPCTKDALCFFAEHAMHGKPAASQAAGDLTITNDAGGYLSALSLAGVRPRFNLDGSWQLYASVVDGGGGSGHTVSLYKDAGRTQLVAQGTGDDSASVTLAEQNASGLSGSVTLGSVSSDDTDIIIVVAQVRPQRSGEIARYFTLWRDTGHELERVIDCTVAKLARKSQELGPVTLDVDIVGSTHAPAEVTTFSPSLTAADADVYLHDSVVYTSDVDGTPVVETVFRVDVELENDIETDIHNASTATAIWKRSVRELQLTIEERFADESKVIAARGFAGSWTSERVVDSHDSKAATWLFDRAKVTEPKLPETDEKEWGRHVLVFTCREETASDPAQPFSLTIQGP